MKLRKLLVAKRKDKELSLREAAKLCNIEFALLFRIETCKTDGSIETWKKIQKGYSIKDKDMWEIITTFSYVENKKKSV